MLNNRRAPSSNASAGGPRATGAAAAAAGSSALDHAALQGPDLTPPGDAGVWVPLGKSMRKNRLPAGGEYLRWGPRDAWAWCEEHAGRVLVRMLVVRMDPETEEAIGLEPGAITAQDLRDLGLSHVDAYVRKLIPHLLPEEAQRRLADPPPRRYGRRDQDWYAGIAEAYLQALRESPRSPIVWMVDRYRQQGHKASRTNVRDWVHAARVHGFLTEGRRGAPGAAETDKLRGWRERNVGNGESGS